MASILIRPNKLLDFNNIKAKIKTKKIMAKVKGIVAKAIAGTKINKIRVKVKVAELLIWIWIIPIILGCVSH